jgi:L-lactate dehydrogenase complex protein LldF
MHNTGMAFDLAATAGLAEPNAPPVVAISAARAVHSKAVASARIPQWEAWREAAHRIKAWTITHLDRLLIQFEQQLKARDVKVHWAEDAEQANTLILDLALSRGVRTVVKAKSMATEEIALNHALEHVGIRSMETDLGEYIVQLAGHRPTHLIGPAMHMSAAEIGKLFADKLGMPYTEKPEDLIAEARRRLRQDYLDAGLGISGVNFGVADTGTLVVVENEGNGGLSMAAPPVHIAVMGIEKLIPRMADLPVFLNLLARSGTGQAMTTYTHLIQGAPPPRQLHIILLDNGRTKILADKSSRQALYCIRCGACLNVCPVYRRTGGWAYGWVYPGPIGAVTTPHLVPLEISGELPFASSLCGACQEACPVKIDIPHQLLHLRHKAVTEPSPMRSVSERCMWRMWAWAMRGPRLSTARLVGSARWIEARANLAVEAWKTRRLAACLGARAGLAPTTSSIVQSLVEKPKAMSARDAILTRIRAALSHEPDATLPPIPELWPAGTWPAPPDLFDRFREELERVQGESRRCASLEEAREFLRDLHQQLGKPDTALVDEPPCRALSEALPATKVHVIDCTWDRDRLASLPLSVMPANFLLADTGTAVVLPRTSAERLLCYLSTVTVLVATPPTVVAHLSEIWDRLTARAADPEARGEILLVTGPSRTADIEKRLVLGAHGPKRLIVLLMGDVTA